MAVSETLYRLLLMRSERVQAGAAQAAHGSRK